MERRFRWGEEGRRARSAALLTRARAEYVAALKASPRPRHPDYPAKDELLAHRADALAAVRSAVKEGDDLVSGFWQDLLSTLGGEEARQIARELLDGGTSAGLWALDLRHAVDRVGSGPIGVSHSSGQGQPGNPAAHP